MKLRDIFCIKAQRVVTNGYTIREFFDGHVEIKINNKYLKFREIETEKVKKAKTVDKRTLTRKATYIPPPNHPWRRYNQTAKLRAERRSF